MRLKHRIMTVCSHDDVIIFKLTHAFVFTGAIPITGVAYGPTDTVPIAYSNPDCVGTEASLADCPSRNIREGELGPGGPGMITLGKTGVYQNSRSVQENLVGVRCEGNFEN